MKTIQVEDFSTEVSDETINILPFEVEFGSSLLLLIDKNESGYHVINGVDGYGQNCKEQYKNSTVIISPTP